MNLFRYLLLSGFIFAAISWDFSTPLAIGSKMPKAELKLKDVSGKHYSLDDLKKKNGLLVIFSCNTCPFVLAWEDRYNELADVAEKNEIGMLLLNSNEAKRNDDDSFMEMQMHAKKMKYKSHYLVDKNHKIADAFSADRTPHVFLFDKESKLAYRGAIDDNHRDKKKVKHAYLKDALNALGHGKEIKTTSSKSLGCSIKRL